MADTVRIAGYEARTGTVGYIYADSMEEAEALWQTAAYHEVDGSRIICVETVIDSFEDMEELDEDDTKLLALCRAAKAQGLDDIVINPK